MLLECVMCLADGDHAPATHMVDVGDHEAAYCKDCALTMKKNGFAIGAITEPQTDAAIETSGNRHSSTPVTEIVTALKEGKSIRDVADEANVSKNTVLSIRRELNELPKPVIGAPSHKTPMNRPFGSHNPVPQKIKEAILSELPSVSNVELERKYHISVSWIGAFRKKNGIQTEGMKNAGRAAGWSYKQRERDIAIEVLNAGKGEAEARTRSGLSRTTIDKIVLEIGLTPEARMRVRRASSDIGRPPVIDRKKIEGMIEDGTSVRSTAALADVSTNTVQRIKREMAENNIYATAISVAKEDLAKIKPEIERLRLKESQLIGVIKALEAMC